MTVRRSCLLPSRRICSLFAMQRTRIACSCATWGREGSGRTPGSAPDLRARSTATRCAMPVASCTSLLSIFRHCRPNLGNFSRAASGEGEARTGTGSTDDRDRAFGRRLVRVEIFGRDRRRARGFRSAEVQRLLRSGQSQTRLTNGKIAVLESGRARRFRTGAARHRSAPEPARRLSA